MMLLCIYRRTVALVSVAIRLYVGRRTRMAQVALLSEALINKIAAGEVVERPASVVKELCENALDAGASTIRVAIDQGGLERISVQDNGVGMARGDAVLAMQRHATSKLRDLDGLFSIETLGFRGEALPSIASVSRFSLTTSEHGAAVGTRIELLGGGSVQVLDAAPMEGTAIEVCELFYNVPARRKYMRQAGTEARHVEEAVHRLALAHPEVSFFLTHDGRELFESPASPRDLRERVCAVVGTEAYPHLLELAEGRLGIRVTGVIASPEYTRPNARGLYTFVNQRYVRDRGLHFAIQRALSPNVPPGRQPVGAIFIEMDPHAVDVNVHPQKLEVRFVDGRGVTDAVHAAVAKAVASGAWLAPGANEVPRAMDGERSSYAFAVHRFLTRAEEALAAPDAPRSPFLVAHDSGRAPAFGQALPDRSAAPAPGYYATLRFVGELGQRFWICEGEGGTLTVLDSHAVHERVIANSLMRQIPDYPVRPDLRPQPVLSEVEGAGMEGPGSPGPSTPLPRTLFSQRIELSPTAAAHLLARRPALSLLGIELEDFGGSTLLINALPETLVGVDLAPILPELVPYLPEGAGVAREELRRPIAHLACHAAKQRQSSHSHEEVRGLLARLEGAEAIAGCPHDRIILWEMPFLELTRRAEGRN
jgi:DNA mismatch repair protein MutL